MKKGLCYFLFALASIAGWMIASRKLEDKRDFR